MDALPKGPPWRCTTIETDGYITTHPVHLIWRDALEVTKHIFGNPIFANDMEFDPYEIFVNEEREYGEWMSSSRAHDIQVYSILFMFEILILTMYSRTSFRGVLPLCLLFLHQTKLP